MKTFLFVMAGILTFSAVTLSAQKATDARASNPPVNIKAQEAQTDSRPVAVRDVEDRHDFTKLKALKAQAIGVGGAVDQAALVAYLENLILLSKTCDPKHVLKEVNK